MGTNYYLHENTCEHCGRSDERIRIGKSTHGWCFALHVIPEEGLNSLADWVARFNHGVIRNEYGDIILASDMVRIIQNRKSSVAWSKRKYGTGNFEYRSEADMMESNYAERGPNNLLRHRIGNDCVGHGSGTWDLIMGDF